MSQGCETRILALHITGSWRKSKAPQRAIFHLSPTGVVRRHLAIEWPSLIDELAA